MPTYVYECSACERVFEVEQRITEDPLKDCNCGAKQSLKRLIQPTAVMFKGSGFHINDYAATKVSEPDSPEKKNATPPPVDTGTAPVPAATESKPSE